MANLWDVLVFVVVGLALVALVVGMDRAVFAFLDARERRREARRRLIVLADFARELDSITADMFRVQPVEREGFYTQYRFPAHDRAECVNAQCAEHFGPFPRPAFRSDDDDAR